MVIAWKPLRRLDVAHAVFSHIAFRPDGGALLATFTVPDDEMPRLVAWDTRSWRSHPVAPLRRSIDWQGVYDAGGKIVAQDPVAVADALLRRAGRDFAVAIAESSDRKRIALGSVGAVEIVDGASRKILRQLDVDGRVHKLAFSADGTEIAAVGQDRAVRVWRVTDGRLRAELTGLRAEGWAVGFSHDGRLLAAGGADGSVRLWSR